MTPIEYFTFGFALFILAIKPGPNFIAIGSNALLYNTRIVTFFVIGILLAETLIMSLALLSFDISEKYQNFVILFFQTIGALAFLWIGISTVRKKFMEYEFPEQEDKISIIKKLLSGFLITIGNPFSLIFFGSLLPTFMNIEEIDTLNYFKAISAIWIYEGLAVCLIIVLAIRTKGFLKNKKTLNRLNLASGLLLIGIGLYMTALNYVTLIDLSKTVF